MDCPKCNGTFETFRYEGVDLDRCNTCQGLFFDATEPERVAATQRPEVIDSGDRSAVRAGRKYDELEEVDCPRCGTRMRRVTDQVQTHIRYESCPGCGGCFFDAGEFRDLNQVSFTERMKHMLEIGLSVR